MNLAENCYRMMFCDCTSLTVAPTLPATTLESQCYWEIFSGSSSISSIKIGYEGKRAEAPSNAFTNWIIGVASTGIFYYNGSDTAESFGLSGWTKAPY